MEEILTVCLTLTFVEHKQHAPLSLGFSLKCSLGWGFITPSIIVVFPSFTTLTRIIIGNNYNYRQIIGDN
jgi:hypothetical protein